MADDAYADKDILTFLTTIDRSVHQSVCLGKVLCPHKECGEKNDFYDENGICHHFRIKHKQKYTTCDGVESLRIRNLHHEQETRDCISQIFYCRKAIQVR